MTPTLLAFLDDVEHNRIPADEVRHRARLARHEAEKSAAVLDPPVDKVLLLRKALTWCGHATPESIETLGWEAHRYLWRVVECVASWSDRQVSGPSSAPIEGVDVGRMRDLVPACFADEDEVPLTYIKAGELRALVAAASRYQEQHAIVARIWGQLGSPTYEQLAGRSIYDLIDELKALASTLPERVAEAVMGEREACAARASAEELPDDDVPDEVAKMFAVPHDRAAIATVCQAAVIATREAIAHAIRSRPAPAHPMAGVRDEVIDLLNALNFRVLGGNLRDANENLREVANLHGRIDKMVARLSAIPSPTPPADDSAEQSAREAAEARATKAEYEAILCRKQMEATETRLGQVSRRVSAEQRRGDEAEARAARAEDAVGQIRGALISFGHWEREMGGTFGSIEALEQFRAKFESARKELWAVFWRTSQGRALKRPTPTQEAPPHG